MADLSSLTLPELQRETQFTSDAYGLLERMADEFARAGVQNVDDFTAPEDLIKAEHLFTERQNAYGIVLRDLYNRLNGPTGLKALTHAKQTPVPPRENR